jgi:hypothetical protein
MSTATLNAELADVTRKPQANLRRLESEDDAELITEIDALYRWQMDIQEELQASGR